MKSDYIERATRFIYSFIPYLRRYSSIYTAVDIYNEERHRAVKYCCGCVRNVFITSDYAIKMDNGNFNNYYIGTCAKECAMFEVAKKAGFDYLFAEITHVNVYGVDFYIMPRVTPANVCDGYMENFDLNDYLNEEERDFLEEHSIWDDMHCGNYGLDKFGEIKILDYGCCIL